MRNTIHQRVVRTAEGSFTRYLLVCKEVKYLFGPDDSLFVELRLTALVHEQSIPFIFYI